MASLISRGISYKLLTCSPSLSIYSQSLLFGTIAKPSSQNLKPRILDPRVSYKLLTCSPSLSIYSQSLLFGTIAKPSSQNLKPGILDPSIVRPRPAAFAKSRWHSNDRSSYVNGFYTKSKSEVADPLEKEMLMENVNGAKNAFTVLSLIHMSLGAWIFYIQPSPSIYSICGILGSAFLVRPTIKMHRWLRRMQSPPSDMRMEESIVEGFSVALSVHRWTVLLGFAAPMIMICCALQADISWDWLKVQELLEILPAVVFIGRTLFFDFDLRSPDLILMPPRDLKVLNQIFDRFMKSSSLTAVLSCAVILGYVCGIPPLVALVRALPHDRLE